MSGTRAVSTTSRRELSSSFFFFFVEGKAPKEIHTIVAETLACFLPGRAKDLSAPLYIACLVANYLLTFHPLYLIGLGTCRHDFVIRASYTKARAIT